MWRCAQSVRWPPCTTNRPDNTPFFKSAFFLAALSKIAPTLSSYKIEYIQHINGGDYLECPVCGKHYFEEENSFDICPICGWENDGVQADDHNYAGGANHLSVNEARIEFFLLQEKRVQETVTRCQQKFKKEYREIQKRYAGLNYVRYPEKAKQRAEDINKST